MSQHMTGNHDERRPASSAPSMAKRHFATPNAAATLSRAIDPHTVVEVALTELLKSPLELTSHANRYWVQTNRIHLEPACRMLIQ